jgi:hypothetical protein
MCQYVIDPTARRHIQRGANELVARGSASTVEALLEISRRVGGLPAICAVLREIEARPRPPRRRRAEVVR